MDRGIDEDSMEVSLTAAVILVEALTSDSTLELRGVTGRSVAVEAEYCVPERKLTTDEATS